MHLYLNYTAYIKILRLLQAVCCPRMILAAPINTGKPLRLPSTPPACPLTYVHTQSHTHSLCSANFCYLSSHLSEQHRERPSSAQHLTFCTAAPPAAAASPKASPSQHCNHGLTTT